MSLRASDGRHPSLRRRLLATVLLAIAVASLAQGISAYRTALRTADSVFDQYLQDMAQVLRSGTPAESVDLFQYSIRIWGPGGMELFGTRGARVPGQPVLGFSEVEVDGTRYRVYQLRTADRTVQVAQDLDARLARARALALRAVLPTVLLAPVLMLAVWLLIERTIAPVERVRREVARRPAEDLSPLEERGLPLELHPLVRELNLLFERARRNLDTQQRFVADAAHELRSPLAALKLQAQAVRRSTGAQRDAAMTRLDEGIERTIALASQLLALARVESGGAREDIDLGALCGETIAELLPLSISRRIDLGLAHQQRAVVLAHPESLRLLLRNLIENAIKFAPDGGRVDVSLRREPGQACLEVEDNGPGIPPRHRQEVFERFARLPAAQHTEGSGLGLSIVMAVAREHGASVDLLDSIRLGGLLVRVRFALREA